jgi:hypothetical protein
MTGGGWMATHDANSAATIADLMSFTWTFLPTATIDLIRDRASDMPRDFGRKTHNVMLGEDAATGWSARSGVFCRQRFASFDG